MRKPKKTSGTICGLVVGLSVFSTVCLIGIMSQIDPFVIAKRAIVSAVAVGVIARVAAQVVSVNLAIKN